jgi:hypothetical protein|tara:strand:+ start:640 stop:939 length:300 start_codon:yes stop_codon:yes gene_type:complete
MVEQTPAAQDEGITMNDVESVVRLIDVVSTRGGFMGDELVGVGNLRQKFLTIIEEAQKAQQAQQEAAGMPAPTGEPTPVEQDNGGEDKTEVKAPAKLDI